MCRKKMQTRAVANTINFPYQQFSLATIWSKLWSSPRFCASMELQYLCIWVVNTTATATTTPALLYLNFSW